ncbi:hypothetical protein [Chondrinema litorale]|uniref:hypothetical protein n=1 Tax=Chondrinema litorale TaxID=2994555 RepID=UPI00254317DC|nr:hypothetical protein [Chondrinema litorale]UZR95937.1 hypothetical protein OQ292_08940 [Chondrinema litorale]
MNLITLKKVLKEMERVDEKKRPVPFSICFVTADRIRKTGGKVIELPQVTLTKYDKDLPRYARNSPGKRKANHWHNATRNILLPNGQIRKLHIRLIVRFNQQTVIY